MSAAPERQERANYGAFDTLALLTMATALGYAGGGRSRSTLLTHLGEMGGTAGHRAILKRRLSDEEWDVLGLLIWELGGVKLDALHSCLSPANGGEGWETLAKLFKLGCFVGDSSSRSGSMEIDAHSLAIRAGWETYRRAPGVAAWAAEHAEGRTGLGANRPPAPLTEAPARSGGTGLGEFQRAAYIILTAAATPIRHKTDWSIYESDITRLAKAFAGAGAKPAKGERVAAPPIMWFALGALSATALLAEGDSGLVPSQRGSGFLGLPAAEQARLILSGWGHSLYHDDYRMERLALTFAQDQERPWRLRDERSLVSDEALRRARQWLTLALQHVTAGDPGAWYSVEAFAEFAFAQYPDFLITMHSASANWVANSSTPRTAHVGHYRFSRREPEPEQEELRRETDWREVEGAFVRVVLREAFYWAGIVELAPSADAADAFRLTAAGRHVLHGLAIKEEASDSLVGPRVAVQPNFDVIVPNAGASFALLAELDQFAERKTVDRAATFTLTQEAFVRALDGEWSLERVVERLETESGTPLPQNVRFSLAEWAALHARLTIRSEATIITAEREAIDRWLADAKIGPLLGERYGPDTILVPAANVDSLYGLIREVVDRDAPPAAYGARPRRRFLGKDLVESIDYSAKPGGITVAAPDTVVAKTADPYVVYRIEALADAEESGVVAEDQARRFTITAESIARALSLGWKGTEIIKFMEEAIRRPIPTELKVRIAGWSGSVKASSGELRAIALEAGGITWLDLNELPEIAAYGLTVPAPTVALVAPERLEHLQAVLAGFGISVRSGNVRFPEAPRGTAELRDVIKRHRDDPEALLAAIRAAGMLGKLDRAREEARWGY